MPMAFVWNVLSADDLRKGRNAVLREMGWISSKLWCSERACVRVQTACSLGRLVQTRVSELCTV